MARDSLALLGQYDAALAAHPPLTGRLAPLRAQVALHVAAFGGRAPAPAGSAQRTPDASPDTAAGGSAKPGAGSPAPTAPSGSATAPVSPGPTNSATSPGPTAASTTSPGPTAAGATSPAVNATPPAASTPAEALAALAAAERTLADRRAAALLTVPGELARLMASVAAAGAAHVVLLSPGAHTA